MINKIIISFMLTFTFLLVSNVESKGQCNCGSGTFTTATFTISLDCEYYVDYCYDIDINSNIDIQICEVSFSSFACMRSFFLTMNDFDEFWEHVNQTVLNQVSQNVQYPPCNEQTTINTEVTRAMCWKYGYLGPEGSPPSFFSCNLEPGKCTTLYKVCYNGLTLVKQKIGDTFVSEVGGCFETTPDFPPDWDIFSDCGNHCN